MNSRQVFDYRHHSPPLFPASRRRRRHEFQAEHLAAILAEGPQRGFFEVHAENYMGAGGPPHRALERLRRDHPVSLHGVCMSIGGTRAARRAHLARFRGLVARYQPALVSEHLAWSTHETSYFNDLLPLPYTEIDARPRLRSHRRGAGGDPAADPARKPVDLCRVSRLDDERDRFHPQRRSSAPDAVFCSTSTTSSSPRPITAFRPCNISPIFRCRSVGEIHLAGHAEQSDDEGESAADRQP